MEEAQDVLERGAWEPGQDASIRDLVARVAEEDPGRIALLAPGREAISYSALLGTIDGFGAALQDADVRPSDRVAVVLPNGPDMAAAFLGVASYATCAPLNPNFSADDLDFYLSDLDAKAVIVDSGGETPAHAAAENRGIPTLNHSPHIGSTDATAAEFPTALILHTSGTTSRPKMVPLTHANLCASAANVARTLELSAEDRCLNLMPLFHIHGLVGVLLSSLTAGATVICTPGFCDEEIAAWMQELRPTWYSAVPTIHQSMLAAARENDSVCVDSLRLIRSSSSALPPQVMSELETTFGVPVIESYGMTEAAHQMASNPLPPQDRKPGSVGPAAGPEMGVMDESGNLLGSSETGELVIRGPGVTEGYIGNPEANAEAFTNGWFRTGDLGHVDADGYYFISGRKKEMINRGGEKVSPREVDEALLEHAAVAQAVAFAVPHATLGEDIAAAVVLDNGHDVDENALRRFAFGELAPFKVPTRIVFVDAIPKGPTGKLQRIGLHEQLAEHLASRYVEPRSDLERMVVAAIEDTLGLERVGVEDNFFALGGDSLKGTRVLARLASELTVELPATTLFLNPTPAQLSLEITARLTENTETLEALLDEIESMPESENRG